MTISIEPVAGHPELHETIAGWLWSEWGTPCNRGLYGSLVSHCRKDTIPAIWVAFESKKPVGTVGLLRTDLLSRQEFTPWMAVLYVLPAYRGKGIASALQQHALGEAKRLGFDGIYLYTKLPGFYERTGWVYVESDVDDHGEMVRIYRKGL
jgi:GNAT superfamily N-acetyltransferase